MPALLPYTGHTELLIAVLSFSATKRFHQWLENRRIHFHHLINVESKSGQSALLGSSGMNSD
jgi:hypothetical protein